MKNKYIYRAHISERKTRHLIKCFALDLTAIQTAELTGLNPNTIDRIFNKIRTRVLENGQAALPKQEKFEVDVRNCGPRRGKSKHDCAMGEKRMVFGLYEHDGKVHTEIIPDAKAKALQAVIRGQAGIESIIHIDGWRGYDGLADLRYEKLFRVYRSGHGLSSGHDNHIKGIENFWSYAKHRLAKFKGIPEAKFELHLKETEFRFNAKGQNIYLILLKKFRDKPLY